MFQKMGKICVLFAVLAMVLVPVAHAEDASPDGAVDVLGYLSELVEGLVDGLTSGEGPESPNGDAGSGDDGSGEGEGEADYGVGIDPIG